MFSFFQRKNIVSDIEWLGVDIHSHLLPGIDDGADDINQSIRYIKSLEELGFQQLICTPHILRDLYPNTPDTILPVLGLVLAGIKSAGIKIEVSAAAEYMADAEFEVTDQLLKLHGDFILIEMSYLIETSNIEQIVYDLQLKGYTVVLAHPERYNFYHTNFQRYERLKDMGCLFQLNLLAVSGYYGRSVQRMADQLLAHKMYDFAGTDLHHDKHLDKLTELVRSGELYKKIGNYEFKNKQLHKASLII